MEDQRSQESDGRTVPRGERQVRRTEGPDCGGGKGHANAHHHRRRPAQKQKSSSRSTRWLRVSRPPPSSKAPRVTSPTSHLTDRPRGARVGRAAASCRCRWSGDLADADAVVTCAKTNGPSPRILRESRSITLEVGADERRQVGLVDHQQVRLRDARARPCAGSCRRPTRR